MCARNNQQKSLGWMREREGVRESVCWADLRIAWSSCQGKCPFTFSRISRDGLFVPLGNLSLRRPREVRPSACPVVFFERCCLVPQSPTAMLCDCNPMLFFLNTIEHRLPKHPTRPAFAPTRSGRATGSAADESFCPASFVVWSRHTEPALFPWGLQGKKVG